MNSATFALLSTCILILTSEICQAGSATWAQTPADNSWSNPSNWMPNTVPNSTTDVATFGASDTTAISILAPIDLANVTFAAGASAYALTVTNNQTLTLWGSPIIINNSGVEQNFVAEGGTMYIYGVGTFDSTIHFQILGANSTRRYGTLWLQGNINLGTARLDFEGGDGHFNGGYGVFFNGTTAGSSTIVLHRGVNNGFPGILTFEGAGAGSANIIAEGASERGRGGGHIAFGSGGAGTATITLQGPISRGALGASIEFDLFSSASASTLIADGGAITFHYESTGGTARIILNHKGSLDISDLSDLFTTEITIGSLEGDRTGEVFLGAKTLIVGSNNSSTVYSGVIQDGGVHGGTGGSLAKIGTRTLTLSGPNLYTGGTTVTQGDFLVANHAGSATGTGPVQVDAGRIGGAGTIAGPLTIGSGSGSGATLIPATGTKREVTTTIESALTFKADASYNCAVNTTSGASDSVIANGVTIDPSATFVLHAKGNGTLAPGTVMTPINDIAAMPIFGNFNGLTEGSTIVAGNNIYQVSYSGGDGNDFTLTVVP